MLKFLVVLSVVCVAALGAACSVVEVKPIVQEQPESISDAAYASIIEARALLDGFNKTIAQNARDGIWTKAQAQSYLDQSKAIRQKLDKAQAALAAGDVTSAESQRQLIERAIHELYRVAAKANRGEL